MELTLKFPDKVKRLVLASTSASVKVRMSFLPKFIKLVRSWISKSEQPYYAFLHQLNASHGYDCSNRFGEINVPTLIMYGKKDKRVFYMQVEEMNVGIKESKLIAFNGGHLFFIWKSKLFIDAILNFLGNTD